ncbi:MAG: complex I 51 kDa subunit family protein [Myxococcota bacterium]
METPLTAHITPGAPPRDRAAYERTGGYAAYKSALREMSPEDVQQVVKDSKLRGRGGAGFPTGVKWGFVPMGDDAPPGSKYLIANADEMEPGTFKDRYLMEHDPHLLVEAVLLSAYAIGADVGYIFLRWAYRDAERALDMAIREAREAGYTGENVLGSGWDVEIHVHVSAGRYMCGEETGLLNAIEGKRATPRDKPPFPPVSGAWGQPTIVNNVETLCNVPHIVAHGADWFLGLSDSDDGGTKLYGASGWVKEPGLWELPLGTTLGEVLDRAGGMAEGRRFRGCLPGGASTAFLTEEHLDVKLDFDSTEEAGSRLGTGTMVVLDDRTCPVGMLLNLERFFAQESCGWCTPCREGLPWTARLLQALEEGDGRDGDLEKLSMHAQFLDTGYTFCALAPGAISPLKSGLQHFREDFERHIRDGRCPWKGA